MKVLLFLLVSFSLHAQVRNPLSQLPTTSPTPSAANCGPNNLEQECARAICGAPGAHPTAFVTGHELDGYTPDASTQAEIDRAMNLMDQAASFHFGQVVQYLEGLRVKIEADLNPAEVTNYDDILGHFVGYRVEGNRIRVVPDIDSSVPTELRAGIEEWARAKETSVQNDPTIRFRLGLSTAKEAQSALHTIYDRIRPTIAADPQGANFVSNMDAFLAESDPQDSRVAQMGEVLTMVERSMNPRADTDCGSVCQKGIRPFLTQTALNSMIDSVSQRYQREQIELSQKCRTGLMLEARLGALPGQHERAMDVMNKALDKVTALPWWSSHTKDAFRAFVHNEARVQSTYNTQEIITQENLQRALSLQQPLLALGATAPVSVARLFRLANHPGNSYAEALPGCVSPAHIATDSFQFTVSSPLLNVSPFSCAHPGEGEGIIAHEMGHGLSAFMLMHNGKSPESARAYDRIRSCVTSQQVLRNAERPDQNFAPFGHDGPSSEEDMADWLSFKSVRTPTLIGCVLLKPGANGMYDDQGLSLHPEPGDPHSSPLLRAMRQYREQRGELPSSCRQLARSFEGIVEIRACQ